MRIRKEKEKMKKTKRILGALLIAFLSATYVYGGSMVVKTKYKGFMVKGAGMEMSNLDLTAKTLNVNPSGMYIFLDAPEFGDKPHKLITLNRYFSELRKGSYKRVFEIDGKRLVVEFTVKVVGCKKRDDTCLIDESRLQDFHFEIDLATVDGVEMTKGIYKRTHKETKKGTKKRKSSSYKEFSSFEYWGRGEELDENIREARDLFSQFFDSRDKRK